MNNDNKTPPQREQEASRRTPERQAWLDSLKVGDAVLDVTGIYFRENKIYEIIDEYLIIGGGIFYSAWFDRDGNSNSESYLVAATDENKLFFKRKQWKRNRIDRMARKLSMMEGANAEYIFDAIEKMLKLGKLKEPK